MVKVHKQILIGILIVSVILRVLAAFYLGNTVEELPGTFDQISYHNLALRVLGGHGFSFGERWWPATAADAPTSHWSFLYTFYLILVYKVFGPNPLVARVIQAVIVGILQPYLAFLVGRKVFGLMVGIAAALVTAIYTYFIYYSATLMTEPFYIILILASLFVAMQLADSGIALAKEGQQQIGRTYRLAIVLGLTLGGAILLRQLFLLMTPFILLWVWWANRRRLILPLFVTGVMILVMIIPFTIYNYQRFQRFVLLNTNAGYAFFWSNHPIYGTHFVPILPPEMGSYVDLIPAELLSLDEAALDQALLGRGIQFIVDDPGRFFLLSLSRIPPYFMFWPSRDSSQISNLSRVTSFGLFLPFMLYGLIRSVLDRRKYESTRPMSLLYLFMGVYALIHVLTWTLIRYRLPIDAILVIFAGLALVDLASRVPALRKLVSASVQS
jgi:hypothetical protein